MSCNGRPCLSNQEFKRLSEAVEKLSENVEGLSEGIERLSQETRNGAKWSGWSLIGTIGALLLTILTAVGWLAGMIGGYVVLGASLAGITTLLIVWIVTTKM